MRDRESDSEDGAFVQSALDGNRAAVKLDECLGKRQSYAGTFGMDAVDLIEAVEDVA